jgi:hypothetical protein
MSLFPKFDPRLISRETNPPAAKPAKPANLVVRTPHDRLNTARLETLSEEYEECAAIIQYDADIPQEWAEGFARLCTMPKPRNISETRWAQTLDAASCFIDKWAVTASTLGWTTHDIFGVDLYRPEVAIHSAGLIWLLQNKEIVVITADAVTVETISGARQTFRPRLDEGDMKRWVLLWEFVP